MGVVDGLRDPSFRGGYALAINTVGTTVIGVAYWAVAAHLYDRQTLGRSSALVSALLLVSSLAQLNLSNMLPRFLPISGGRSAARLINYSYFASAVAAFIGASAFVLLMPYLSPNWKFLADSRVLAALFVVAAILWGVFALQDAALVGLQRAVVVPVENVIYAVLKLILLVALARWLNPYGLFSSWVAPLAGIVLVINWLIFHGYLRDRDIAREAATTELRPRAVIRFASIDYAGTLFAQAYGNLLPLLVLSTLGASASGTFYIAWTIVSGLTSVAANFAMGLLVEGAAAPSRVPKLTRGVLMRCFVVTVPGVVVLATVSRLILQIYGPQYAAHATTLLSLLSLSALPSCLIAVTLSLDRIAGKPGRAALTQFAVAVLVLGGSWVLLKRIGVDGVAFASCGGTLLVALARMPTVIMAAIPRQSARAVPSGQSARRPGAHRRPPGAVTGSRQRPSSARLNSPELLVEQRPLR